MTKKGLKKYAGQSLLMNGIVEEISTITPKFGNEIPSILIKNLFMDGDTSQQLTDHVWLNPASMVQFDSFPSVSVGDKVRFKGYVVYYQRKNHQGSHFDNTISSVCEFEVI